MSNSGFTNEEMEELFGRGAGDPDVHGYPGQEETEPSKVENQNT